ncbi:SIS domain-containing protein [Saccharothrix sp. S26]|uniref:6-phospho-3-hexuloisomerase n=1 Tax=Saccharothrix sp. S26 TaxID=2907215 RepID=UPI001F292559|nr:6-phospho-3-hexuloisomerase [Saccharothrix sp. S26]MCE7000815.1 SIS domain-containing protein [Saccharothrix sp. S26]
MGSDGVFASARRVVIREIDASLTRVDEEEADSLIGLITQCTRVFVLGAGRSKLAVDGFAMRLVHLGLAVHVTGDTTTPAIGPDDLLLVCSGSGETPGVVSITRQAAQAGARVAVVTAAPGSTLTGQADLVVLLREYSQDHEPSVSTQFVGTLFEQAAFVFFDCLVMVMQRAAGVSAEDMFARHTNLE